MDRGRGPLRPVDVRPRTRPLPRDVGPGSAGARPLRPEPDRRAVRQRPAPCARRQHRRASTPPPGGGRWSLCYPAHFTSLSPMLVIAPADADRAAAELGQPPGPGPFARGWCAPGTPTSTPTWPPARPTSSPGCRTWPPGTGPGSTATPSGRSCGAPAGAWSTTGPPPPRSRALEHEVFHSWFGRGVKPARAADGWIDEAWTTWATGVPPGRTASLRIRRAGPRRAAGRAVPPAPLGPAHPDRGLYRGGPAVRRSGRPLRRARTAPLRHGRLVPGQRRPCRSRPTGWPPI